MKPRSRRISTASLWLSLTCAALAIWLDGAAAQPGEGEETAVDFGRDIRPVLSDKCFACHGPDEATREADLRLDLQDEAFRDLGGYFAIVPGKSADSELYMRVSDHADPMPPEDSGKELSPQEIELFRRWIDQGASWEAHWAYLPPERTEPPAVADADWVRNPIDRFVLARLEAEGLAPAEEAGREALIRRLTLDLNGLPPTLEEIDAFLADDSPNAYERLVDRLFATPRYGEHMARAWLDAARYGDTHGYHLDNLRLMWPYRDWVIRAFNQNMPFDRFTIEQLAGDILPDPTTEQLVATGFNRCNVTSAEGGMIEDEFRVIYAVDRVVTTSTVWMGTTMLCAQCHDHKFDPVSQKEFYELFGFFNNITEAASDGNAPSPAPVTQVPSTEQRGALERLDETIAAAEDELEAPIPEVDAAQVPWADEWRGILAERWHRLEPVAFSSANGAEMQVLEDGTFLVAGENPNKDTIELLVRTDLPSITGFRLDALKHEGLPEGGPGRGDNGNFVLSSFEVDAVSAVEPGAFAGIAMEAAYADYSQPNYKVAGTIDDDPKTGWGVHGRIEDARALFVPSRPFQTEGETLLRIRLRFDTKHERHVIGRFDLQVSEDPALLPATFGPWHLAGPFPGAEERDAFDTDFGPETGAIDLEASYGEAAIGWTEKPELADGEIHELEGEDCATYLYRVIESPGERDLELSLGTDDAVKLWLNGENVLDLRVPRSVAPDQNQVRIRLRAGENQLLMKVVNFSGDYAFTMRRSYEAVGDLPIPVAAALTEPEPTDEQLALIRDDFRRTNSPEWKALFDELTGYREERATLDAEIPVALIMEEREERRPAHLLKRGRYDLPQEEVQPGTPAFLPPLTVPADRRATRLDLARWLVEGDHPLTARVYVNRLWQGLFGTGLVKTAGDFGAQGEWPSHPELLDWLATELVASGWNVQHMLKLMVGSATYRQKATSTPEKRAEDPRNRLLSRGPRFRLDGERIRDAALFTSGLLVEKVGGPSVNPYQPPGIWEAVAYTSSNTAKFERDAGEALYRRSLYTFWKRTAPPATMQIFDAPTRESCVVARARTNTPLQALALMNDVQFVEAARAFAQRILLEGPEDDEGRLVHAFRSVTARRPNDAELEVLRRLLSAQRADLRGDPEGAEALLGVGESELDAGLDRVELAAWTQVANLLLNMDEVVTKG